MADDDTLRSRLIGRNPQSFEQAYLDHFSRVRNFLRVSLGNAAAGDDLAQDTFLQLWMRPDRFDPSRSNLRTYLLGIARKKAADWWRHHRPDAVKSVEVGAVHFEIAAHRFEPGDGNIVPLMPKLASLKMQPFTYVPGKTLEIPIEGGGTLTLRGEVVDHQPKIAWGLPLEPCPGQLLMRSPVLVQGDQVIADLAGGSATAGDDSQILINSGEAGEFRIGLRQFPGSVEGEVNWGQLKFKLDGKDYLLTAGAPICGGEQPQKVWVSLTPSKDKRVSIGSRWVGSK